MTDGWCTNLFRLLDDSGATHTAIRDAVDYYLSNRTARKATMYTMNDLHITEQNQGIRGHLTFPNGYTASVVCNPFSYGGRSGLYELAVIHDGRLVYDTPITNDVIGHLTESQVDDLLNQIAELPERS